MENTQGPWGVDEDHMIIDANGNHLKHHSPWQEDAWEGDEEANANMTLMAAAPDLLEACHSSCELCQMMHSGKADCKPCIIGKAIKKAEGK